MASMYRHQASVLVTLATTLFAPALFSQEMPPIFDRAKEIELALSACPPKVASGAAVYALERSGYVKAREGKNGFSAIIDRTLVNSLEPRCMDAEATRTVLPRVLKSAELRAQGRSREEIKRAINEGFATGLFQPPARPSVDYMLSTHNIVPIDEEKGIVAPFPPHLMFFAPYMTNADIGSDGSPTSMAFIVSEGTPHALIIVPVGQHGSAGHAEAPRDPRPRVFAFLDSLMPGTKVVETVTLPVSKQKEPVFRRYLEELIRESKAVPGLTMFDFYTREGSQADTAEYFLHEVWQSPAGLRKQWESQHLRRFQERMRNEALLTGASDLRFYLPQ